jgi:tRNA threonylcarbamoyladenosine biosynthesis protein TsaB
VIVLGFDTATRSTAVGLRLAVGETLQSRDDPGPSEHPGHATRLLGMADELLTRAGIGWSALERIAVGLGPGTFTGLRVGVATARGLAQSLGVELVGVSSLRALAEGGHAGIGEAMRAGIGESGLGEGARPGMDPGMEQPDPASRDVSHLLAVLDARRGEAFAAAYRVTDLGSAEELVAPRALAPEHLGDIVEQAAQREGGDSGRLWRAIGDGAVRFRGQLEAAGVAVAPDSSPLHLLSAEAICDLGASAAAAASWEAIVPDYGRRPDAEIALERASGLEGEQVSAGVHAREGR